MRLSPFFKSSLSLGSSTLGRLLIGLVKTKLAAIWIGPQGVGILGLMSQLELLGMSVCSLSIGSGLARKVSQASTKGRAAELEASTQTAAGLLLAATLVFIALGVVGTWWAENSLAEWSGRWRYLLPVLVAVPIHAFIGSCMMGVFFGFEMIKEYSRCSIFGALCELGIFLATVKHIGVSGALWATAVGFFAWLVASVWILKKRGFALGLFKPRIRRTVAVELIETGFVMGATGVLAYLTSFAIRAFFLEKLGPREAGIYHVSIVFSSLYMPFLTNGIWARLHPKASSDPSSEATRAEWAEAVMFVSLFGSLAQAALQSFSPVAIFTLYSKDFLEASHLVPYQMAGDFFFLAAQPSMAVLLAEAKLKPYLLVWSLYYLLLVALTLTLTSWLGMRSASVAYMISSLAFGGLGLWIFFRAVGCWRRIRRIGGVLMISACVVGLAFWLQAMEAPAWVRAVLVATWACAAVSVYFRQNIRKHLVE